MNWPRVPEIRKLSQLPWSQKNNMSVWIPQIFPKISWAKEKIKEKKKEIRKRKKKDILNLNLVWAVCQELILIKNV